MNTVVFWQNMPSHILAGPMRHFAERWRGEVHAVFDESQMQDRKELGWEIPDLGEVACHFLSDQESPQAFAEQFVQEHADAIHVLGGFRGCLAIDSCRKALAGRREIRLASIAERPLTTSWWKTPVLNCWYRSFFRRHGKRFGAVLAMGTLGVETYASLGCPEQVLYPYLYHVSGNERTDVASCEQDGRPVKFVYVGQFIRRKGVDVLLDSLSAWPSGGWELTLIGRGGECEDAIVRLAKEHAAVHYAGVVPSERIVETLADHDVCLVPSRHDGWGVVTNEAVLAGIGTIVSDRAASFDLVRASGAGEVIPAGDPRALAEAVRHVVDRPECAAEWRSRATKFASQIEEEPLGAYLHDVLDHAFVNPGTPRPTAAWLLESGDELSHTSRVA